MMKRRSGKYTVFLVMFCLVILSGLNASAASKIRLNETSIVMETKHTYVLELLNASGKTKWLSTDKNVASVSSSGEITANAPGACRIVVMHKGIKYYCFVTVVEPEARLNRSSVSLEVKEKYTLKLKNAKGTVKWKSTDPSVAEVSSSGKITAKKAGNCKVYAQYNGVKYICRVTVSRKAVLSQTVVNMKQNKMRQLNLRNAVGTVTWRSSDKSVATVSRSGKVTSRAAGTCQIIARYRKRDYICTVNVYTKKMEWMPEELEKKYDADTNKGKLILIGSSSVQGWKDAANVLAPLDIINMGIGGSKVEDWIELYPRLVTRYEPEAVVVYVGNNNMTGRAGSMSGEQTAALLRRLLTRMKKDMPDTPIYYVSNHPSERNWSAWEDVKRSNRLMKQFCSEQKNITYIELGTYFLGSDGRPNPIYYRADNLHPNEAGYELWKKYVAKKLKRDLL